MNILEELKVMQAQLDALDADINSKESKVEELKADKKALAAKIEMAVKVSRHYEDQAQEKIMFDSEAFATLVIKIKASCGAAIDDDIRQYSNKTGVDLPQEFDEAAEEEPQELLKATN